MSCVLICVVSRKDQTRSVSRKRGDWICLKPESSQKPELFVGAVPCPWCVPCCQHPPSVFLSSCSAVQNHVDRPSQRSSPRPVSHDPCLSLDHTKADSMSSASACVYVRPPDSAVHVNLFIRQNVRELCVFVCVSMTQRDDGAKKLLKRPQLYFYCSGLV